MSKAKAARVVEAAVTTAATVEAATPLPKVAFGKPKAAAPVEVPTVVFAVGSVLETEAKGAIHPLLVFAHADDGLRVCGPDSVELASHPTSAELHKLGYRVVATADVEGLDIQPPKHKITTTERVEAGERVVEVKREPLEAPPVTPAAAEAAAEVLVPGGKGGKGKGKGKAVTAAAEPAAPVASPESGMETRALLDAWVWGVEPGNFKALEVELKGRGMDCTAVADAVTKLLDEAVAKLAAPAGRGGRGA
jgi:hypothetical protein